MTTRQGFGLLTLNDIAQRASVTAETMKDYRRLGLLPPEAGRVGRQPVWTEKQVQKWLAARAKGPMKQLDPSFRSRAERRRARLERAQK